MIRLPKSAAAWGTASFDEVLANELREFESQLPLERFCTAGGWPQPGSLTVRVDGAKLADGWISVSLLARFSEAEMNACCEVHPAPAGGSLEIRIHRTSGEAEVLPLYAPGPPG